MLTYMTSSMKHTYIWFSPHTDQRWPHIPSDQSQSWLSSTCTSAGWSGDGGCQVQANSPLKKKMCEIVDISDS